MRPSIDAVMLGVAMCLALRALCAKRQVGCVLVDKDDNIISTGYNGKARGTNNCEGCTVCVEGCDGVHAEINALLRAPDPQKVDVCYVTTAPCWHCTKALINTSCRTIVFNDKSTEELRAKDLWTRLGGEWIHMENADGL